MTSSVKVSAHCARDKEVVVVVTNAGVLVEEIVLQDGEAREVMIYDERAVSSRERLKEVQAAV
ncbi:hypothetical protein D3C84_1306810 [compost metagenome]